MKIIEYEIENKLTSQSKEIISAPEDVLVFFSEENSTGKTTLLRSILYALGFSVPNVDAIKYDRYKFTTKLTNGELTYDVYRDGKFFKINEIEYTLPDDAYTARGTIFGVDNKNLSDNFLGTIYFDQENGWTKLHSGQAIGNNYFNINNFLLGLNDENSDYTYRLKADLAMIEPRIAQMKLAVDVAEYHDSYEQDVENKLYFETYDEKLLDEQLAYKQKLSDVQHELDEINEIIRDNEKFVSYISKKQIYIKNDYDPGNPILVSRENLNAYDDTILMNNARRSMLIAEKEDLRQKIAAIDARLEFQMSIDGTHTTEEKVVQGLSAFRSVDPVIAKKELEKLKKDKKQIQSSLTEQIKRTSDYLDKIYRLARGYADRLGIPAEYKMDVMANKTKKRSGAILHKLVFSYKLAYIKVLSEKLGYDVPIFCDSPGGREVTADTFCDMMKILKDDFAGHQIFIATIMPNVKEMFPNAVRETNRSDFD